MTAALGCYLRAFVLPLAGALALSGCKKDAPATTAPTPINAPASVSPANPAAPQPLTGDKRISGTDLPGAATPGIPVGDPNPAGAAPEIVTPHATAGSPTAALYKFVKASAKSDFKALKVLVTRASVGMIEMAEQATAGKPPPVMKDQPVPSGVVEKVTGDRAVLTFSETARGSDKPKKGKVVFVKEDGEWRFDLNSTMTEALSDPTLGAEEGGTPLKTAPCTKKLDRTSPKKSFEGLTAAAKTEDIGCMREYFSKASQNFVDAAQRTGKKDVFKIAKTPMTGATETIEGDRAALKVSEQGMEQAIHMVREDGQWRFDLGKTIEDGLKKMQEVMKKMKSGPPGGGAPGFTPPAGLPR